MFGGRMGKNLFTLFFTNCLKSNSARNIMTKSHVCMNMQDMTDWPFLGERNILIAAANVEFD